MKSQMHVGVMYQQIEGTDKAKGHLIAFGQDAEVVGGKLRENVESRPGSLWWVYLVNLVDGCDKYAADSFEDEDRPEWFTQDGERAELEEILARCYAAMIPGMFPST